MAEVQEILNLDDDLNDSFGSSVDENAPAIEIQAREVPSQKLLKGKIQAGIQNRVNDFWREKVGSYVMQGDYLALHMEEQSCLTWRSYLCT